MLSNSPLFSGIVEPRRLNLEMDLSFQILKSAPVWTGFGAHCKRGLLQNQIVERVVYSNTLSINWFSYCSKLNSNSYLDSLGTWLIQLTFSRVAIAKCKEFILVKAY